MAQAQANLCKPVEAVSKKTTLKDLFDIEEPDEKDLRYDKSDEEMFDFLVNHYGDKLNDMYYDLLICFIQGYAHEKERKKTTIERIDHFLDRNKVFKFPTILDVASKDENECLDAWPVYIYGYDKQGHPIMWDEIPSSTVDKVKKVFSNEKGEANYDKLRNFRFRFLRRLENSKVIQSRRYNKKFYRHVMVMDMAQFSRHHIMQPMRDIVASVITDESNLWPNTLQKMFIINAPFAFRWGWKIISAFVHPITVAKVNILGSDYLTEMTKWIDISQIPKKYGGKGELPIDLGYVADVEHSLVDCFYKEVTIGDKVINKDKKTNDKTDENNNNNNNETDEKTNENDNNTNNTNNTTNDTEEKTGN